MMSAKFIAFMSNVASIDILPKCADSFFFFLSNIIKKLQKLIQESDKMHVVYTTKSANSEE